MALDLGVLMFNVIIINSTISLWVTQSVHFVRNYIIICTMPLTHKRERPLSLHQSLV